MEPTTSGYADLTFLIMDPRFQNKNECWEGVLNMWFFKLCCSGNTSFHVLRKLLVVVLAVVAVVLNLVAALTRCSFCCWCFRQLVAAGCFLSDFGGVTVAEVMAPAWHRPFLPKQSTSWSCVFMVFSSSPSLCP